MRQCKEDGKAKVTDDLRQRILDAATTLFIEEGYESVSMRKIAQRIDYAPSSIYLHFRDKVDLVSRICMEAFGQLDARLDGIIAENLPPMEALRRCLRQYIQFGLDHPSAYMFAFCTPTGALQHCGSGSFQRLRSRIQACMDTGGIPPGDVESLSQSTWLLTHGVTSGLMVEGQFPFVERERLIDESLDRILLGVTACVPDR